MATNNFATLPAGHGVYAFLLNAQGRIQADLYVFQRGESLLVDTERGQRDKVLQLFDHYIIADDVEIADISDKLTALGLTGPESRQRSRTRRYCRSRSRTPAICGGCLAAAKTVTLLRSGEEARESWQVWIAPEHVSDLWDALLQAGARPIGHGSAESFPHLARHSAIWRGHPRARSAAGNRADAGVEFHQRMLSRAGDCGAHPLARRGAPAIYRVRGRGHAARTGREDSGRREKEVGEITSSAVLPLPGGDRPVALGLSATRGCWERLACGSGQLKPASLPIA